MEMNLKATTLDALGIRRNKYEIRTVSERGRGGWEGNGDGKGDGDEGNESTVPHLRGGSETDALLSRQHA